MNLEPIIAVLERARKLGFLGPGPVAAHLEHSTALAELIGEAPTRFLDLGSGGGVPGLVLACLWPDAQAVLLDAMDRRCTFLREAVEETGLSGRVTVEEGRAETLAREERLRSTFPLVVARGFAAPPVVAECAAGFLEPQGRLCVTEPPEDSAPSDERWPIDGLAQLGLVRGAAARRGSTGVMILTLQGPVDGRWPRRVGVPTKRPLW
jgi:16S rRNA (guanine527-N7)-methyltransferase